MQQDTQILKGILEGCILVILKHQETYGYLVVQKLKENGFENISEATVYPILTRLCNKNMLSTTKRPSDIGPPRKYYKLTEKGEKSLIQFTAEWDMIKRKVERLMEVSENE